ncbi:MAG TPA: hypothetical protein VE619_04645 [Nitrososphaeraceae archaeon]|nr:hypothetical protein [Nitrososphaeraceae archaeon]
MFRKTPSGKGVCKDTRLFLLGSLILICGLLVPMPRSYAHFSHLAHYNIGGMGLGKYYVNEQLDPEYTLPRQPTKISFSIQDTNGNDVYNIVAMVEIYMASTGERVNVYPWTRHDSGDFDLYYTFPQVGNYQIVISIANSASHVNLYGIDPPRFDLGDNSNCDCARAIFNVNVSNNFGNFFEGAVFAGVGGIIVVFGSVLGFTYKSRRKSALYPNLTKHEVLKYIVLLLAVAAGIVHLVVYSEHGGLRIEYSIFLLTAGATQIAYSVLYVLLTISEESIAGKSREPAKAYYRKTVIVNLFGLIGTSVLLGLYAYSVILPPPLSPNNAPEDIDLSGILDKSLEISLVIGIIYLMGSERRKLKSQLVSVE